MINAGTLLMTNTTGSATGSGAGDRQFRREAGRQWHDLGRRQQQRCRRAGASVGTLNLGGSYTQTSGGSLAIELVSIASYDQLAVTGPATLAGALRRLAHRQLHAPRRRCISDSHGF